MRQYDRINPKDMGEEILGEPQGEILSDFAQPPLLTVGEAAKYLGVSRKTLYRIIEMGQVTAVRAGKATLIEKESLDAFKEAGMLT
jgi:excisionase family DNA binding protein